MASTNDESAEKRSRLENHRGADAERGEDAGEPLQDDELEEEEDGIGGESETEGGDVPGAATEDLASDAVLLKLVASDYGANSPTSKGARRLSFQDQAH